MILNAEFQGRHWVFLTCKIKSLYDEHAKYLKTEGTVYIYSTPPPRARCDTRPIFKRSTTGLNSEFSFSETGCLIKVKEFSLPIAVGEELDSYPLQVY